MLTYVACLFLRSHLSPFTSHPSTRSIHDSKSIPTVLSTKDHRNGVNLRQPTAGPTGGFSSSSPPGSLHCYRALDSSFTLNKRHPTLFQRTPCEPTVEATHIPVTGDGRFGPVTGRYSNASVRYDSTDHGAPPDATGTNTQRSCAEI